MITERTIINGLIIGASFILVPFLIFSTFSIEAGYTVGDYLPALIFAGLAALAVAFFFLRDRLCICPMLGGGMAGSLNFLPIPLKATHIACILLILYYATGYILIRQSPMKLGKREFLWPILILTSIVLYHNHALHLHALGGGGTEGAKPAMLIYLVVFAYFCGINISPPSVKFLSKVPLYFVILSFVSNIPQFLTTYVPSLAPYLYYITDNVNVDAYLKSNTFVGESSEAIGRFGFLSAVAGPLQLYLLCHYPIGTWLRPSRWWVAALSLICAILTVASGYRNVLFGYSMSALIATWCYYSWRALALPTIAFLGVLIFYLGLINNVIQIPLNRLPLIAQRTMSFLPGDWDTEALESAKSSDDFRKGIQDVYKKEYMDKSPLLGNGFDINTKEFDNLNNIANQGYPGLDRGYLQSKIFIEGKIFHVGWVSLYDSVGIIGFMVFIILGCFEILVSMHFVFGPKADHLSPLFPLYVWMLCGTLPSMIGFFTVFGDFAVTFMNMCVTAIVLSQLSDLENSSKVTTTLPDHKREAKFSRLGGTHYDYQPRH